MHQKALETANEGANVLKKIFTQCYEFCKEIIKDNEIYNTSNTMIKSPRQTFQNGLSQPQNPLTSNTKNNSNSIQNQKNNLNNQKSQPYHFMQQNQNNYFSKENNSNLGGQQQNLTSDFSVDSIMSSRKSVQQAKEEVYFQKLVVEYAFNIIRDVQNMVNIDDSDKSSVDHFRDAKRSLYFWKNNPENNEKHIRQELHVPTKLNEEETRSILGVQNGSEWIESFNIGSIMHMIPVQYEEFSFFGDIMYEISKKVILEKVIYLSISYFTIATEIRFIEIERNKNVNLKNDSNKNIDTDGFKKSQIYHLKSIEIVCQHITCKSPYINHLITSYHKHYNQNLETIVNKISFNLQFSFIINKKLEESFSSFQDNNLFDGSQHQQNPFLNKSNNLQQEDQLREGKQFEELVNKFVNGMSEDDQTPVYIQNNPHLSNTNNNNMNNSSMNNLQNNSIIKFNSINGQIIQGDDILLSANEKHIPSPQTKQNNINQKKQNTENNNLQKQQENNPQSNSQNRPYYLNPSKNSEHSKDKKTGQSKKQCQNSSSTHSAHNKKNLNLDFNGSNMGLQSSTNNHSSNINQNNINPINRNLIEFFSHDNSKKNTPRGILNIRKSTPAVEQSSSEVAMTEPNASSSNSQPRQFRNVAKKPKQNNLQAAQLTKIKTMSIEKVAQILKNNLLASYSTAFLQQNQNILNHQKNPSTNQQQEKKKPKGSNTTEQQGFISSPNLKKKTVQGQQDPLRMSACETGQIKSANGQRTNNSSNKTNNNNNSSSVPSTTQSSTKSKKQASATARQQTSCSTNPNQQVYCNTDRQLKNRSAQQQKVTRSELKDQIENMKIQKNKAEDKQTLPFKEDCSPDKKKMTSPDQKKRPSSDQKKVASSDQKKQQQQKSKEVIGSNKKIKEQKNVEYKKNIHLSNLNFLSLKTINKETIQQLLKESQLIPKLNLNQLKIKCDEIRFFSPREKTNNATTTSATKNQQI